MTSTLSPADTGEIETGGETARLSDYLRNLPPTRTLRRADATGEIQMPRHLGIAPAEPAAMPLFGNDAQAIAPLERVIDPAVDEVAAGLHRSAPYAIPDELRRGRPRHRRPSLRTRLVAFVARLVKP